MPMTYGSPRSERAKGGSTVKRNNKPKPEMVGAVHGILLDRAKRRGLVRYAELSNICRAMRGLRPLKWGREFLLYGWLYTVNEREDAMGRPLLAAIVVNQSGRSG